MLLSGGFLEEGGCCSGVTPFNFALANYEDCGVLLEVHFTITVL